MKSRYLLRVICLLALLASFVPAGNASALVSAAVPPVDMFQLPWEQGLAWVAIDGLDNGTKRPLTSSHHFTVGGAIDFAPHNNMVKGENTSTFWTTAAAAGTVVGTSACHVIIDHSNGWITQYQFLANVQVKLGDAVSRNQRLGIIADGVRQKFCPGSVEPNVPHLHFMLRPTMRNATFAGWQVNYLPILNKTTFTKNGETLGLFKPLLNVMDSPSTPTPTTTATSEPTNTPTPSTSTLTPTPTALTVTPTTPSGPFVLTEVNPTSINIEENALVTVSLNNVPPNEYTSAEFTCTYDEGLVEASSISVASLFGADPVTAINGPQNGSFIVAIAGSNNNKATTSGAAFTFDVKGLQAGQTALDCAARVSKGDNVLTDLPAIGTDLVILGSIPTATSTPTPFDTPTSVTPVESSTSTPVESSTPVEPPPIFTATPTSPVNDWLTFTNVTYGFEFKYPPQGVIADGRTDNFARIDLPFVQGTNLQEKYLEVTVTENATTCKSPLGSQSSETITINGIQFLKETAQEGGAGHLRQWVAYSTERDNVCVSLGFILHSLNAGNFPTPPPVFDFSAESAVFGQMVETFIWLAQTPTATLTFTPIPVESQTPTATQTSAPLESPTAVVSPTATQIAGAVLTGQVIAVRVVGVRLYDTEDAFVAAVNANPDGTFRFEVAAGTYTVVATANGFLRIQGSITLAEGDMRSMPVITLLAGDIDDNNEIDQFDAMTIGFNYNTTEPPGADLNNDGIINVLDLELLAKNYRKTGPIVWE